MAGARTRKFDEDEAVRLLSRSFALEPGSSVAVGIGDDAAVLEPVRGRAVWTVDTQVDGVHFDQRWLTLEDVGYRSFQAAVSDLAAMGATPRAALSSLILPESFGLPELRKLAHGQALAASASKCPIVGGNLSRGTPFSVTTTALGDVGRGMLRSSARVNDELWLVGELGMAAAGLKLLAGKSSSRSRAALACMARWRRPKALLARGAQLARVARAALDVSDGLVRDARRLAEASGVRVVLSEAKLRAVLSRELLQAAQLLKADALELALYGGEDYALLATGAARRRPRFARAIGRLERGQGVLLEAVSGADRELSGGFDHFAR